MLVNKVNAGFTLLELMIVVAIIGILAAVAIPGFSQYIRTSKKNEAAGMLKALSDGAMVFYKAEHAYDPQGFRILLDFFPGCDEIGADAPSPCNNVTFYSGTRQISQRISPDDPELELSVVPWTRLNFNVNKPFYYQLFYTSDPTPSASTFSAQAKASLSSTDDSVFEIHGQTSGIGGISVSNIVEIVDNS